MLFRQDYSTPGPGVRPDEPEKTGPARLWQIIQIDAGAILQLNLLFLLTCVPVVTIPLAVFGMNWVMRRMMLDRPVLCFHDYRAAIRRGWKQAYAAFFIVAAPLAASGFGVWFYLLRAMESVLFLAPFVLCSTVFLATLLSSTYLYGLLSAGMGVRQAVRTAVILGIGRPLRAVLAAVCGYGLWLFGVLEFPISLVYLVFLGFSLPCLLANFFVRTVLRPYCADTDNADDADDADGARE